MRLVVVLELTRCVCVLLQFEKGLAAKLMMEMLTEEPPKVAVYGPGHTSIMAVTALLAPYYKVVEVGVYTYASSVQNAL